MNHRSIRCGLLFVLMACDDTQAVLEDAGSRELTDRTEQQAIDTLAQDAQAQTELQYFSGVVRVWRDQKVLFEGAYGLSDREAETVMVASSKLRLGSVNKIFTTVAVLQLVEKGMIDLDAPLAEYLTAYPNQDLASRVTPRHLLTHSGGTGNIFDPEYAEQVKGARTHSDYLAIFGTRELAFEPGTNTVYSNYGFILLGAIIEQLTGESYYDWVRVQVFEPAGMTATGSLPESEHVAERAVGYMQRGAGLRNPDDWLAEDWGPNTDSLPYRGTAAGGGYSTAADMHHFAEALRNHELIADATLQQAVARQPNALGGLGFAVRDGELPSYGHNGGARGMNAEFRVYPERHLGVAILSNLDPPSASRLADRFEAELLED
jgi:CubicO group peptidase (beta-lactamase class C family)